MEGEPPSPSILSKFGFYFGSSSVPFEVLFLFSSGLCSSSFLGGGGGVAFAGAGFSFFGGLFVARVE